jgi:hypothetical protein
MQPENLGLLAFQKRFSTEQAGQKPLSLLGTANVQPHALYLPEFLKLKYIIANYIPSITNRIYY